AVGLAKGLRPLPYVQEVSNCLAANTYDFVPKTYWPPNSPDLNPMDYFFLGPPRATHQPTGSQHQGRPDQLHNEAGQEVGQGLVAKACSSFSARIQRVIDAEGGWIK
ncbi:Putative LOC100197594, partial [Caligus rogercresseyi]